MKYRLYKNSRDGMHCVQACLQMLLHYFGKPVLSLEKLDDVTSHRSGTLTWMSDALIWLEEKDFDVENYENLDYKEFAEKGRVYLQEIWDAETFILQDKYSDLDREQKMANELLKSGVKLVNSRLTLPEVKNKIEQGFFTMLSINPYALKGNEGYGSHLLVVKNIGKSTTSLLDPDADKPYMVSNECLQEAISENRKNDFNAIFVKPRSRRP